LHVKKKKIFHLKNAQEATDGGELKMAGSLRKPPARVTEREQEGGRGGPAAKEP